MRLKSSRKIENICRCGLSITADTDVFIKNERKFLESIYFCGIIIKSEVIFVGFENLTEAVISALDIEDYDISLGGILDNGIQQIILTDTKEHDFCEECRDCSLVKKCQSERIVLDVLDKQPVQYIIKRYRYKCRYCRHLFTRDDIFSPKIHATSRYEDFLAQKIMQNDSLSLKCASEMYGVSQTYASNAIHKYEQRFEDRVISVRPCHSIVFYPFEYGNRIRCCVIGTDFSNKHVLLGMLPDYAESTLLQFVKNKIRDIDGLKTIYCDLNATVFQALAEAYPEKNILVIKERIAYHCNALNRDSGDGYFNQKNAHIKQFLALLKESYATTASFESAVHHWKDTTPVELNGYFDRFLDQIMQCITGCVPSASFGLLQRAVATMFDVIKRFRKKNTSFDIMVLKTWFLDEAILKQIKKTAFGKYMSMAQAASYDGTLRDYGVDIDTLGIKYLE